MTCGVRRPPPRVYSRLNRPSLSPLSLSLSLGQFLHCVRLWTRVVCAMPRDDQLGPLVFPLSQVMFGVLAAAPR